MKPLAPSELVAAWPERERKWARELGRIRLGVEPIPDQVAKYRGVAWVITAVAGGIGLALFSLFAAFRSPILGLSVAGILMGPVIVSAWIGFLKLESCAKRYLHERAEVERVRGSSG